MNASISIARAMLAAFGTLAAMACVPLPIPHSEQVTPPVVGSLHLDESDVLPRPIMATTSIRGDADCSRGGTQAQADEAGRFTLSPTREHRRIAWLSLMDRVDWTGYWLCARTTDRARGDTTQARTRVIAQRRGDTVSCFEYLWQTQRRIACNTRAKVTVDTGGTWHDGGAAGSFRLIIAVDDPHLIAPVVLLQWIEGPDSAGRTHVRQTLALPLAARFLAVDEAKLWPHGDRPTCVGVRSRGRPSSIWTWRPPAPEQVTLELGAPGHTREIASCD